MGVSFLCICPPKSIRFDDSKDTSQAEISARLDAVPSFRGQSAGQLRLPGAGAVYLPAPELSIATEESCFAVFKGYALLCRYLVFWITECRRLTCVRLFAAASSTTTHT